MYSSIFSYRASSSGRILIRSICGLRTGTLSFRMPLFSVLAQQRTCVAPDVVVERGVAPGKLRNVRLRRRSQLLYELGTLAPPARQLF